MDQAKKAVDLVRPLVVISGVIAVSYLLAVPLFRNKFVDSGPRMRLMPEHGDYVRGADIGKSRSWYVWLVCVDCEAGRYMGYKAPPYPQRCVDCAKKIHRSSLGQLTLPASERRWLRG